MATFNCPAGVVVGFSSFNIVPVTSMMAMSRAAWIMASSSSATTHLVLKEEDVIKLACEFLGNREMFISQVTVERESGVINGNYSDDMLFLRQLILDGQWDDVMEFIQPLASLSSFNYKLFQFMILKAKYIELLCIKSESLILPNPETAVDAVVEVLNEIEKVAPTKEVYSNLCLLLTVNKLSEHPDFKTWNPNKGRNACFKEIKPLCEELLGGSSENKKDPSRSFTEGPHSATNDRLLQLLIKGILYDHSDFSDSDLSLLSWLQSIPSETFSCPFEQRSLNVDVERIKAPVLETNWTEHMLVTPIKPNIFPHSAMPHRSKGAEIMTKSLNIGALSAKGGNRCIGENGVHRNNPSGNSMVDMSKSFASFHLTGKKLMDTSVDQLFLKEELSATKASQIPQSQLSKETDTSKMEYVSKTRLHHSSKPDENTPTIPESHALENNKPQQPSSIENTNQNNNNVKAAPSSSSSSSTSRFLNVTTIEDVQALRCAEFHPSGKIYAVGSNSKTLRICQYPNIDELTESHETNQPVVLFKRTKHHKGSIYCLSWNNSGNLVATGSNDKTVKLMKFNTDTCSLEGNEVELTMHDGTIRDCTFLGRFKVFIFSVCGCWDYILSLYTWGGALFVSGSADKTVRFWDLRSRGCVNMVQYGGSSVASCSVDPSGRLLVTVQSFKPHNSDVRSVRFSPSAFYLLSTGYDNKVILTDLQGDLTSPLPSVVVATHSDKVISGRWHPTDFSFLSSSADKTATLWALPPL
ncbi:WD repeat-containing protein 47 [Lepeophtheirus salmonis]|uniref:WD repeat-containing protein 47 n=1 Tax=Lepeophtheirus salmonis TaxID=72036 RepID=A0A7R8CUL0_LEPSM|nr:WD repeat-containing protein 47 [Lepeophtheirus salmonis]CAF2937335.1 WD repeat-containing protein 47 [Lepeophtheirus salmonis]